MFFPRRSIEISINNRLFPRIKLNVKVFVEIVNIEEEELLCTPNSFKTKIVDISMQGMGLNSFPETEKDIIYELLIKKMKIRLNFELDTEGDPVHTFAFLVRYKPENEIYGLEFVDTPVDSFTQIRNLVDKMAYC